MASWLLPVSNRDFFAVGGTRSHGCGCTEGVRHFACSYHMFKENLSLIIAVFGRDIEDPARAFLSSRLRTERRSTRTSSLRHIGRSSRILEWPQRKSTMCGCDKDVVATVAGLWDRFGCSSIRRNFLRPVVCAVGSKLTEMHI